MKKLELVFSNAELASSPVEADSDHGYQGVGFRGRLLLLVKNMDGRKCDFCRSVKGEREAAAAAAAAALLATRG